MDRLRAARIILSSQAAQREVEAEARTARVRAGAAARLPRCGPTHPHSLTASQRKELEASLAAATSDAARRALLSAHEASERALVAEKRKVRATNFLAAPFTTSPPPPPRSAFAPPTLRRCA